MYVPGPRATEGTNPVNKKLVAALSGGAVLVLALSGCSSDDTNDKLNSWAKQVCDDVQPQIKKIAAANASIQKETSDDSAPEDVQRADSQGFQDISDAYKAMATAIQTAGAPDVEDGEKKQKAAVAELNQLSSAYAELKTKSDALNTKDQAKFADGLEGVATELEKLSKTGSNALKELEKGEVGQAMAKQASCKSATASGSASAPATKS
ncbi:small secreted protein [Streptomyces ipomoeae]|uniref:Small secreted protein n=1 Tax=Streptomyces ipomoeae TaxID=103232 RepID=A0A540NWR5_9ACTN|nr:small secreted protein [Streptomyces ipomoeae]TQE19709.1 small secreted protein [Streptomyces ipomoeae]TQE32852.1 small secreted protein [Streptomyces ipomoeae]